MLEIPVWVLSLIGGFCGGSIVTGALLVGLGVSHSRSSARGKKK